VVGSRAGLFCYAIVPNVGMVACLRCAHVYPLDAALSAIALCCVFGGGWGLAAAAFDIVGRTGRRRFTLLTHDAFAVFEAGARRRSPRRADQGQGAQERRRGRGAQVKASLTKGHPIAEREYGTDNTFLSRRRLTRGDSIPIRRSSSRGTEGLAARPADHHVTPIDTATCCVNYDGGGSRARSCRPRYDRPT